MFIGFSKTQGLVRFFSPQQDDSNTKFYSTFLGFHGEKQGSGPNRGQSPVEWGDCLFVCLFVHPLVHPSVSPPPLGHPARPEAKPARPEAQPARAEA